MEFSGGSRISSHASSPWEFCGAKSYPSSISWHFSTKNAYRMIYLWPSWKINLQILGIHSNSYVLYIEIKIDKFPSGAKLNLY